MIETWTGSLTGIRTIVTAARQGTEAFLTVPAGTTSDIVREPAWRTRGRDWAMRLMDFRMIQGPGPNRCRW
ncbi:MAG TPA: hypothetical protein VFT84_00250 [Gemmatimonadales bacterium]|nr:hypothetical protein [Gemmatimonadales bacterium]